MDKTRNADSMHHLYTFSRVKPDRKFHRFHNEEFEIEMIINIFIWVCIDSICTVFLLSLFLRCVSGSGPKQLDRIALVKVWLLYYYDIQIYSLIFYRFKLKNHCPQQRYILLDRNIASLTSIPHSCHVHITTAS